MNEAFASQSLAVSRELKLDGSKVNVYGGGPRGGGRGAAALCVGGGMGTAMIIEAT